MKCMLPARCKTGVKIAAIHFFHSLFTPISGIGNTYTFPTTISRCKTGINHSYLKCKIGFKIVYFILIGFKTKV